MRSKERSKLGVGNLQINARSRNKSHAILLLSLSVNPQSGPKGLVFGWTLAQKLFDCRLTMSFSLYSTLRLSRLLHEHSFADRSSVIVADASEVVVRMAVPKALDLERSQHHLQAPHTAVHHPRTLHQEFRRCQTLLRYPRRCR